MFKIPTGQKDQYYIIAGREEQPLEFYGNYAARYIKGFEKDIPVTDEDAKYFVLGRNLPTGSIFYATSNGTSSGTVTKYMYIVDHIDETDKDNPITYFGWYKL